MKENNHTEVLTALAACVLSGRTLGAVRAAAREGHVDVAAVLVFGGKEHKLFDLDSVLRYWGLPRKHQDQWFQSDLEMMRRNALIVSKGGQSIRTFSVLSPIPLMQIHSEKMGSLPEGEA